MLEKANPSDILAMIPNEPKPIRVNREPCELVGYPPRYRECRLDLLSGETHSLLNEWIDGRTGNLLLWGAVGCGKTYAAAAAMKASHLAQSEFVSVPLMLLEFQSGVHDHDERELIGRYSLTREQQRSSWQNYQTSETVGRLFDDVGAHRMSDFSIEMFGLLLERLYAYDLKGFIFTTNLTPKQIMQTMSERVSSRLCGLCKCVEVKGSDRRLS